MDKKTRFLARVFSIAFGIAMVKALYDGGFHYYSMGSEKGFIVGSSPIKYWLSIGWYFVIFSVSTYFGFIVKNENR